MEQTAALRAEWLTQVGEAIEGAQRLAWQLGTNIHTSAQARELYSRLEAARVELDCLRGLASLHDPLRASDVEWLEKLGWSPEPPVDA